MRFTDPERKAAFNLPLFVHGFLKEFRKKKDDPIFLEDQRLRLKKWDDKRKESFLRNEVIPAGREGSTTAADDVPAVMAATAMKPTMKPAATAIKPVTVTSGATAVMSATASKPATTSNATEKSMTTADNLNKETNSTAAEIVTAKTAAPIPQREVDDPMDGSHSSNPLNLTKKAVAKSLPPVIKSRTLLPSSPARAVFGAATHTVNPLNLTINSSIKSKPALPFRRSKPTAPATPGPGSLSMENAATDTVNRFKQPLNRSKPPLPFRPSRAAASAIPGPGPRSMEIAAAGIMRYPRLTSADLDELQPIDEEDVRKFRDIEEEHSSDSEYDVPRPPLKNVKVDGKGKMKELEVSKKRQRKSSGDEKRFPSMNVVPRKRVKSAIAIIRGRGKVDDRDEEDSEESGRKSSRSDGDDYDDDNDDVLIRSRPAKSMPRQDKKPVIRDGDAYEDDDDDEDYSVIRSRPAKTIPRQDKKPTIHRSPSGQYYPIPTGEYHDSKCSRCRIMGRSCEIQKSGGACVNCRRYKHKCEYSRPRGRKEVKSKPIVESEDESPLLSSPPPPSRHPRAASAVARKAIKKAVIASEIGSRIQIKRARSNGEYIPLFSFHIQLIYYY
jgi:hypothetical protein